MTPRRPATPALKPAVAKGAAAAVETCCGLVDDTEIAAEVTFVVFVSLVAVDSAAPVTAVVGASPPLAFEVLLDIIDMETAVDHQSAVQVIVEDED